MIKQQVETSLCSGANPGRHPHVAASCGSDGVGQCLMPQQLTLIASTDADAAEIGRLYGLSRTSLLGSMQYAIEFGQHLAAKKASLKYGVWLPWLERNADVLGFDTDRTARRLLGLAAIGRWRPI